LHNNQLRTVYLTDCKELQQLFLYNNCLKSLDLSSNKKLKILYGSYNFLLKLEVNHLKDLMTLHCEGNDLEELNCSGLEKLTYLYCFLNNNSGERVGDFFPLLGLKDLNIEGCKSLQELDAGECFSIEKFELINYPNLLQSAKFFSVLH
jgi:Leucine-rich repeat (LRR) protein